MSSLSNLPYGKILDYWYEKLSGRKNRIPFLLTKTVEVFSFKSKAPRNKGIHQFTPFVKQLENNIPENPIFSIVIPCFVKNNTDLENLKNLIQSINHQSVKANHIIIVDDCSPLKYNLAEEIIFKQVETNSGPAKARNIGKEIAKTLHSDVVAFADTDCILQQDWVATIIREFQNNKGFNILSGNTISNDRHWFGTYHNLNGTLNGRIIKASDKLLYGTTANLAISAAVNESILFNEGFTIAAGEDIEFCFRANQNGFAIKHIPGMVVRHNFGYTSNPVQSFRKFTNQFQKYGEGERILLKFIPEYYAYFDNTNEVTAELN